MSIDYDWVEKALNGEFSMNEVRDKLYTNETMRHAGERVKAASKELSDKLFEAAYECALKQIPEDIFFMTLTKIALRWEIAFHMGRGTPEEAIKKYLSSHCKLAYRAEEDERDAESEDESV